jgi:hypothetical protein
MRWIGDRFPQAGLVSAARRVTNRQVPVRLCLCTTANCTDGVETPAKSGCEVTVIAPRFQQHTWITILHCRLHLYVLAQHMDLERSLTRDVGAFCPKRQLDRFLNVSGYVGDLRICRRLRQAMTKVKMKPTNVVWLTLSRFIRAPNAVFRSLIIASDYGVGGTLATRWMLTCMPGANSSVPRSAT